MSKLISKNIRTQRTARGMTQEELAAKIFTTRQTISNYETGKSKPDYETIGKIAVALGVNEELLLYDADDRHKKIKIWCVVLGVAFLFALARSLKDAPLIVFQGNAVYLTYELGYVMIAIPVACCFLGWGIVRFYELYICKRELHFEWAKRGLTVLVVFFAVWLLSAFLELPKIYEAASDPTKNQFGGPAMLSVYLETFYYKYIFRPLAQLPILNCVFVLLGSIFSVCLNGKEVNS